MRIFQIRCATIIRLTLLGVSSAVVSLTLLTPAHAALEAIEQAYELEPDQVLRWPRGEGDSLVIRPCTDCEATTLRVTGETDYKLGFGKTAPDIGLDEMLRRKSRLRGQDAYLVIVFFDPADNRVNRMVLQTGS